MKQLQTLLLVLLLSVGFAYKASAQTVDATPNAHLYGSNPNTPIPYGAQIFFSAMPMNIDYEIINYGWIYDGLGGNFLGAGQYISSTALPVGRHEVQCVAICRDSNGTIWPIWSNKIILYIQ